MGVVKWYNSHKRKDNPTMARRYYARSPSEICFQISSQKCDCVYLLSTTLWIISIISNYYIGKVDGESSFKSAIFLLITQITINNFTHFGLLAVRLEWRPRAYGITRGGKGVRWCRFRIGTGDLRSSSPPSLHLCSSRYPHVPSQQKSKERPAASHLSSFWSVDCAKSNNLKPFSEILIWWATLVSFIFFL